MTRVHDGSAWRLPILILISILISGEVEAGASDDSLLLAEPPQAQPGQCWAQLIIPARMERRVESVQRQAAGEKIEVQPVRYEWVERPRIVPAGQHSVVIRAAEYEVTEEQVLLSPAGQRERTVPALYRSVEERVVTRTGPILKPDPQTGQPCVVDGPVEYQIVHRKVLVEPERAESVEQAARYKTVRHKRLLKPAETKLVDRPEHTITERVRQLVEPAQERRVALAPVFEEIVHLVEIEPARHEWRQVLCETNLGVARLAQVQQALRAAGFEPGLSDGRWGPRSAEALRRFQQREGLAEGGLSLESLEKLGLSPASS